MDYTKDDDNIHDYGFQDSLGGGCHQKEKTKPQKKFNREA
jgi:hypothetical protein